MNIFTNDHDTPLSINDAPRLIITLAFIEGIGVWIYSLRQLSIGGPYGALLGLSLNRFIILLVLLGFITILGLLLSRSKSQRMIAASRLVKTKLIQTKSEKLLIILGGFLAALAIVAYYSLHDIQYRVLAVVLGYFGLIFSQVVIVRYYIKYFVENYKSSGLHIWGHPFIRRASQPLLIVGYITLFSLALWYRVSSEGANILDLGINLNVVFYLVQVIILSISLGVLLVKANKWVYLPAISRFWIGFCSAPFVLGSWVLCLATLFPGAPRWAFSVPLPIIALLLIGLFGRHTFTVIRLENQADSKKMKSPKTIIILYLMAALVLGMVAATLLLNSRYKVIDRDALRYMAEGLAIAQRGSLEALSFIRGSPMGIVYGDQHGFMFPAILSHAMLINGGNAPGYPHDNAVRISFQLLEVYMFLSMLALTSITRKKGTSIIAWLLLLGVPTLGVISYGSFRDPLRILAYFLLAASLVSLSPQKIKAGVSWKPLFTLLILAGFSISSHGASTLIAPILFLAWIIWHLLGRTQWKNIALVGIFFGSGCLMAGFHIIQAYIETGTPLSVLAENTLYVNELNPGVERAYEPYGDAESLTHGEGLVELLARDEFRLSIAGLLSIFMSLILWLRDRKNETRSQILFVGLVILALTLPFLGVFDTKYYQWSKSYVYNYRYSIHWYPFAAVCLSMLVTTTDMWIKTGWMKRFIYGLVTIAGAFYAIFAFQTINSNWEVQHKNTADRVAMDKNITLHEQVMMQLAPGEHLLINDQIFNYYLNNQAILYLTPPTREIALANNVHIVRDGLEQLIIGALILYQNNFFDYYDRTSLFEFLDDPRNAYISDQNQDFRAYIINSVFVAEHNLKLDLAKSDLEYALTAYKNNQLEKAGALYQAAISQFPEVLKTIPKNDLALTIELVRFTTHPYITFQFGNTPQQPIERTNIQVPPSAIDLSQGSLSFWGKLDHSDISNLRLAQANTADELTLSISNSNLIHYFYYYYHNQLVGRVLITITDDAYHNFVLTWQDGVQMMFIDGEQVMFANNPAKPYVIEVFTIDWAGDLMKVIVYDRALTPGEIYILSRMSR